MSTRGKRINALFEQVADLSSEARAAFLDRACANDRELRHAVERRLSADAEAGSFLDDLGSYLPRMQPAPAPIPDRLGPYEILGEIGRGGMGTVYAARRDDETFRRDVAIKVIASGSERKDVARRFRAERRILALLEHPGIAHIYDGGTTPDGAPYLVMERVEGSHIDQHCTTQGLSVSQRVALVREICAAVHYAHRNLVVHRDLKPSNILVTADGTPKLLDFGIAKILDPETVGTDDSVDPTAPWQRLLTLNYASPEQIRGESISTATDIYSLGVLLFVLLTDTLPRSFEGLSPWRAEQDLVSTEPARPSAAVVARAASTDPGREPTVGHRARKLARQLAGDLDAIVLKALRTDPEARYGSAEQLAEDLDRHLRGLPISARRGTWRYRTGKLLRRHRLASAATIAAIVLALTLIVSLAHFARTLRASQHRLETEQAKLQETNGFLLGMFEHAGPYVAEGVDLSLRQAVDQQASRLEGELARQPATRASVLATLGWLYLDLGAFDRALDFHQQALTLRRTLFDEQSSEIADSLDGMAAASREALRWDEAQTHGEAAIALARRHAEDMPSLLLRSLNNQVSLLCMRDAWADADPFSAEALALGRTGFDSTEPEVSKAILQRAQVLANLEDAEGALALYQEARDTYVQRFGPTHAVMARLDTNLGQLHARAGRLQAAIEHWRQADAQFAASFGSDFYDRVAPLTNLGHALRQTGDLEAAEAALRNALDVAERSPALGPEHELRYYGRPAIALGKLLEASGRCAEAVRLIAPKIDRWVAQSDGRIVQQSQALLTRCRAALAPS